MNKKQAIEVIRNLIEEAGGMVRETPEMRQAIWYLQLAEQTLTGGRLNKLTEEEKNLVADALRIAITKRQLAKDLNVSTQTIRSWTFDRNRPLNGHLRQLKKYVASKGQEAAHD